MNLKTTFNTATLALSLFSCVTHPADQCKNNNVDKEKQVAHNDERFVQLIEDAVYKNVPIVFDELMKCKRPSETEKDALERMSAIAGWMRHKLWLGQDWRGPRQMVGWQKFIEENAFIFPNESTSFNEYEDPFK